MSATDPWRPSTAAREPSFWLLIASTLVFFERPLFRETFFFRDLYQLYFPKKLFFLQSLRSGHFPLWDPLAHNGQPFLANPNHQALYPTNLIFLLLPEVPAFNVNLVLQFLLCAAGAYSFARILGLGCSSAFTTGAVYTFCGYTLSSANLTALFALPWIPITLALAHLAVTRRSRRSLFGASITGAMPLFGGAPEAAVVLWITVILWILIGLAGSDSIRRRLTIAALILLLNAGLSLVQTVPAVEMMLESTRGERSAFQTISRWSLSPYRLLELTVPRFFGHTDTLAPDDYWGARREDVGFPYILSIYIGAPALLLAILALADREFLHRRQLALLATLTMAGIAGSLGRHWPFADLLYEAMPIIGVFRYPVKLLMFALLPLAILAGAGVASLARHRRLGIGIAAAAAMCFAALSAWQGFAPETFERFFFAIVLSPGSSRSLASGLLQTVTGSILLLLVLFLKQSSRAIAATAVVLVDLMSAGWSVNAFAPRELLQETPPIVAMVQEAAGNGRFYRTPDAGTRSVRAPSNDIIWLVWWRLRTLSYYTATRFGVPVSFHDDYDNMAPRRTARLSSIANALDWRRRLPIVSAAGVRAILTEDEVRSLPRLGSTPNSDGRLLHLYANGAAAPVRFASRAVTARSDEHALQLMQQPFDPRRVVVYENAPGGAGCTAAPVVQSATDRRSVVVETTCAGYVVFAETFYPGWRARLDGRDVPLVRADYAFSAVRVPAGRHRVETIYRPLSVTVGAVGSLMALAAAFVASRKFRPAPPPPE